MKAANARAAAGIMLAESDSLVHPLPGLLDQLSELDRQRVRMIGRDKVLESGEFVWYQGDVQTGIYLIRSGRIRSYYVAPSGREVTMAQRRSSPMNAALRQARVSWSRSCRSSMINSSGRRPAAV